MAKDPEKLERIRVRAYHIWEQKGRPEGGHMEHWEQALREEEGSAAPGPSKRSRSTPANKPPAPSSSAPKATVKAKKP